MSPAPESLCPTICVGEIHAKTVATEVGHGLSTPPPLTVPCPNAASAIRNVNYGRINLRRLKHDEIKLPNVVTDAELPTGTVFVHHRPDANRDFVFNLWTSTAKRLIGTNARDAASADGANHDLGEVAPTNATSHIEDLTK